MAETISTNPGVSEYATEKFKKIAGWSTAVAVLFFLLAIRMLWSLLKKGSGVETDEPVFKQWVQIIQLMMRVAGACIEFLPAIFLFRFSMGVRRSVASFSQMGFAKALLELRSFFMFYAFVLGIEVVLTILTFMLLKNDYGK